MLYTLTIKSDTRSMIDVDDTYTLPIGAACQSYTARNANCPNRAEHGISINQPEYFAMETYCEDHIGSGILDLLQPEPNCC